MTSLLNAAYRSGLLNPGNTTRLICAIARSGTNLHALLQYAAWRFPGHVALIKGEHTYTYAALLKHTNEKAVQINTHICLKPGTRIAICLTNTPEMLVLLFAIARSNAHIFLVSPQLSKKQTDDLLSQNNISYYFSVDAPIPQTISHETKEAGIRKGNISILSSGTGGQLKAATRPAKAGQFILPYAHISEQLQLNRYRSIYIAVPLSHGYGFAAMCMAVALGKTILLSTQSDTYDIIAQITAHRIECMAVVPTQLQRMQPYLAGSHIKCIISGGAPLPAHLAEKTLDAGYQLFNLYGTSEAGVALLATPRDLQKFPGTIGKPIKGAEVSITQQPDNCNKAGHILIRSPWAVSSAGWTDTGDIGNMNEEGYYFVCGRADKMIVSGGENVYPETVEQIALQHPSITAAAAIGTDDAEYGQSILLYVVADKEISAEDIREWLRSRVARYELPRKIVFVSEIPQTPTGKPIVSQLNDLYPQNIMNIDAKI